MIRILGSASHTHTAHAITKYASRSVLLPMLSLAGLGKGLGHLSGHVERLHFEYKLIKLWGPSLFGRRQIKTTKLGVNHHYKPYGLVT